MHKFNTPVEARYQQGRVHLMQIWMGQSVHHHLGAQEQGRACSSNINQRAYQASPSTGSPWCLHPRLPRLHPSMYWSQVLSWQLRGK
jgi:hypothetical protein